MAVLSRPEQPDTSRLVRLGWNVNVLLAGCCVSIEMTPVVSIEVSPLGLMG
jgi:hypothetical protein